MTVILAKGDKYESNIKAIGGKKSLPLADKEAWDGNGAVKRMRTRAGGPDKDKVNWGKYKDGFVYFDQSDKENFGSYKLPFADVIGGTLKAVRGGIVAAMAAVNGARGGVAIEAAERKRAYNFLAAYYRRFDLTPPDFRA